MEKPWELEEAEIVDSLCRRYGCPPSVILGEEAAYLLHMRMLLAESNLESS